MPKLMDLTHRKEATDLLVDCATLAVWYGFPVSANVLLQWMKHRTDSAGPVMWIDALRCLRFGHLDDAQQQLRAQLLLEPGDISAKALLAFVLQEDGQHEAARELTEDIGGAHGEASASALIELVRSRRHPLPGARTRKLEQGVVIG